MRTIGQSNPNTRLFQIVPHLIEEKLSQRTDLSFLKQVLWRTHGLDGAPRATVAQLVESTGASRTRVAQVRQQLLNLVGDLLSELSEAQHDCPHAREDLRQIECELNSLSDVVATSRLENLLEARGGKATNPGWVHLLLRVMGFQPVRLHAARGLHMEPACFRTVALSEKTLQKVLHKLYALEGRASEVPMQRFIQELRRSEKVEIDAVQLEALIAPIRSLEIHQGAIRTVTRYLDRPSDRKLRESAACAEQARQHARSFEDLVQRSAIVVQRPERSTPLPSSAPGSSLPGPRCRHRPILGIGREVQRVRA